MRDGGDAVVESVAAGRNPSGLFTTNRYRWARAHPLEREETREQLSLQRHPLAV